MKTKKGREEKKVSVGEEKEKEKKRERNRQERIYREDIRGRFAKWAQMALKDQGFTPARHHLRVIEELEGVAAGDWDRLLLLLPPGSAKSTYASALFVPWFLSLNPRAHVIAVSHTASLAWQFGRGVRGLLGTHKVRLGLQTDPASRSAGRFGLASGGSYFACGVRGPLTGRRADLIVVDDPVKSQREADSAAQRDHLWDWFRSDLVTRLRPGGRLVVVMTRWHPDDLGGRLLAGPDGWRVLRLPALAEEGDALGRAPGEALWPEWEDAAALERKRLMLGERAFAALFQQSPRPPGVRVFDVRRVVVSEDAMGGSSVRAWDLAASDRGGDWTVGLKLVRGEGGMFQIADVVRFQGGPEEVVRTIRATAERDGREVRVGLPQDPGQAGKSQVSFLTSKLAGWRVESGTESGSKSVRAMPVASQVNAGNVSVLRGRWNRALLEEMEDFPGGAKDDQVDALSRAFGMLTDVVAPARRVQVGLMGR